METAHLKSLKAEIYKYYRTKEPTRIEEVEREVGKTRDNDNDVTSSQHVSNINKGTKSTSQLHWERVGRPTQFFFKELT